MTVRGLRKEGFRRDEGREIKDGVLSRKETRSYRRRMRVASEGPWGSEGRCREFKRVSVKVNPFIGLSSFFLRSVPVHFLVWCSPFPTTLPVRNPRESNFLGLQGNWKGVEDVVFLRV